MAPLQKTTSKTEGFLSTPSAPARQERGQTRAEKHHRDAAFKIMLHANKKKVIKAKRSRSKAQIPNVKAPSTPHKSELESNESGLNGPSSQVDRC